MSIRRRSFRLRLALMAVALVAVPLAVVGWVLIDVNRTALEDSIRAQLRTVVADLARAGDRALDESEAVLTAIAKTLADGDTPEDTRVAVARRLVSASPDIDQAGIYDERGATIEVIVEEGAATLLPTTLPEELGPGRRRPAGGGRGVRQRPGAAGDDGGAGARDQRHLVRDGAGVARGGARPGRAAGQGGVPR
ncbi:MAG: hypothetical protein R3B06_18480 [Kofleriaceae bacterium]